MNLTTIEIAYNLVPIVLCIVVAMLVISTIRLRQQTNSQHRKINQLNEELNALLSCSRGISERLHSHQNQFQNIARRQDNLETVEPGHAGYKQAIALYVNSIVREAGSLISILKGLDGFVFTAGIGENAVEIRRMVCEQLGWYGIELNDEAHQENQTLISSIDSAIKVYVIPTNEELMIAQHTLETLADNNVISLNLKTGN